jgi:hypothetical protein
MKQNEQQTETTRLRLRLFMADKRLSAVDVGALLNVRPQSVRCWMCGVRGAPSDVVRHLRARLRAQRRREAEQPSIAA